MNDKALLLEVREHVGLITINRPEVHNALSSQLLLELEATLDKLERDDQVRVIVVTGAGERAFIAGGDIAEMNSRQGLAHYQEFAEVIHRVMRRFETCDKPTIAAVNGYALGGGTELLLALDIRVLAVTAKLGLPEITLGLFPGAGGTQRLIRQVGPCLAKEMMFTGDHLSAEEAVRIGLANRVVPLDRLMDETMALAQKISKKSPLVLKLLKRALREGAQMPLSPALAHEQALISLVFETSDAHEGMSAFMEKRNAQFTGR